MVLEWSTWADGSQGPLAEQVLGRRRAGPEPPGAAGLHVGLLVAVHAGGPGAVVQEAVRGHHLGVASLAAAHAALQGDRRLTLSPHKAADKSSFAVFRGNFLFIFLLPAMCVIDFARATFYLSPQTFH